MKKWIKIVLPIIGAIAVLIIMLHPVRVVSGEQTRYIFTVTFFSTKVGAIGDLAGGARCYINDKEYIWLSDGTYVSDYENGPLSIKWTVPWKPNILRRGG